MGTNDWADARRHFSTRRIIFSEGDVQESRLRDTAGMTRRLTNGDGIFLCWFAGAHRGLNLAICPTNTYDGSSKPTKSQRYTMRHVSRIEDYQLLSLHLINLDNIYNASCRRGVATNGAHRMLSRSGQTPFSMTADASLFWRIPRDSHASWETSFLTISWVFPT